MNDSLAKLLEYTESHQCTSLPLLGEGATVRETFSVLVYNMGPGEHSQKEVTLKRGATG